MNDKSIQLSQIILDAGTQIRADINSETVAEYAEAMLDTARNNFPAVVVFRTGPDKFILADGFHRVAAAKKRGFKDILAKVHEGSRTDALKFALEANTGHGLRLTNADKHQSVELALAEWPTISNNEIARICAVSHTLVNKIRPAQVESASTSNTEKPNKKRVGKDGKEQSATKRKKIGNVPPAKSGHSTETTPADSPAPAPERRKDSVGVEIPAALIGFWDRGAEIREILGYITAIRARVKKAEENNDPLFAEVGESGFSVIRASLNDAWSNIKRAIPYAVCTLCQGIDTDGCAECKGRGFISELFWERCVPEEKKKMRKAGMKGDKAE